jgi:outer membrane protein
MKKQISFLITGLTAIYMLMSCNGTKTTEQNPTATEPETTVASAVASIPEGSIAHVNLDSLTANYLMTKDLAAELEAKMKKLDDELANKQKTFQANVTDFQNKAQKGLETRLKLAEIEQQLNVEQQNLLQLSETYRMQMAEEQTVMQNKIVQAIMDYLKEYNKDKGFKYILGNRFDAKILYADPTLDITQSVLQGINAKYQAEHPVK